MATEISPEQASNLLNKQAKMITNYKQRLADADVQNVSLDADNEILKEKIMMLEQQIQELQKPEEPNVEDDVQ